MTPKTAVQMYTVREHTLTAADLSQTLKKISDIGYTAVQVSCVGAMNGDAPEVDAKTARRMLDDNGLKCIATHRAWESLADNLQAEIDFHHTLGCDYIALGGVPAAYGDTVEGYRRFIAESRSVVDGLKAAGIQFGLHNHSKELFRPVKGGPSLLDIMIDDTAQDVMLELDLYWLDNAGTNCERILERCHGRVPVIHLKDKEVSEPTNETRMAPIGEGNLDWDHIIPACEAAGVRWYAVEQDQCFRDPFDCLKSSYEYLSGKGL
ncbi:sugar phosphate isomerase/epimerase [Ruficoccus amylovorans]|uniref:Sugar phosphate isomerase/epimerase n=1 Tax=Ruficoccus amylovorans TaxID=1804625 RepID=A0A842HA64_9BACT|nr:sugar phosphate isomerase/epimerase [Ruficoccus amylovorans]MBC2593190.1 sugar phosphate isomerase/epimerase [Ruficoccus amylovorans]